MWRERFKNEDSLKNKTDASIIDELLKLNDQEILSMNINSMAKHLKVSPSTITKFLYKWNYTGWKMFKTIINISILKKNNFNESNVRNIILNEYAKNIAELIIKNINKKIIIFAHGMTLNIAKIFSDVLRRVSFVSFSYDSTESITNFKKSDNVYIFLSCSGKTKSIIKKQSIASSSNSPVVLITVYNRIINSKIRQNYWLDININNNKLIDFTKGSSIILNLISEIIIWINKDKKIINKNAMFI